MFYDAAGWSVQLPEVNLRPLGNGKIDINAQLASKGWIGARSGTAVFQYQGKRSGALTAEVYMENSEKSVSFTIPGAETPLASATQNAVFWLPSPQTEVYVALQNTSNTSINVFPSITIEGQNISQPLVQLAPYGSSVLEFSRRALIDAAAGYWRTNTVGGISLTYNGPPRALNAGGWVEEDTLGYSTTMTFQDPTLGNGKLMSTQILVGDVSEALNLDIPLRVFSQLVVYNVGDQPTNFEGDLVFSQNGNLFKAPIQTASLAPGGLKRIDLNQIKSETGVPVSFSTASVILQYSGKGGTLMARVYGASEDRAYGFYWALQPGAGQSYSESYWTTESNWTSIISVANVGTATDDVTVELTSNSGIFSLPSVPLKPLESRTINVRDLIQTGTTDRYGKPFPADVKFGGYRIYGASRQSRLIIREHLIDSVSGLSTPFYGVYTYADFLYFVPANVPDWDPYRDAPYSVDVSGNTVGVFSNVLYSDGSTGAACPDAYYVDSGSNNINATRYFCDGVISGNQVGYASLSARETNMVIDADGDVGDVFSNNYPQITSTPSISWNGNVITNTSASTGAQNAVAGQQIYLNGSPGGGAWAVDGNAVGGFDIAPDLSSGQVETLFVTSDPNVLFYWVDGGTKNVTYTVSGVSASAQFSVGVPTFSFSNGPYLGSLTIRSEPSQLILRSSGGGVPGFGYTVNTTAPSGAGSGNSLQTVQIAVSSTNVNHGLSGNVYTCTASGLDTNYPARSGNGFDDSPAIGLDQTTYSEESNAASFDTYIMWNPATSSSDIFIPLEHVVWSFSGDAVWNGSAWTFNGNPSTSGPSFASTQNFPQWTSNVTNVSCRQN